MESNAAGMVRRLALKTRFSEMGWGSTPLLSAIYKCMKQTIALFCNHPKCSIDCSNAVLNILQDKYRFKLFTKHRVDDNFLMMSISFYSPVELEMLIHFKSY